MHIHQKPPKDYEAKSILDILDHLPVLTPSQLELIKWMAAYYMCSEGEVLNAALPSGLKLSSESVVQLNPSFNFEAPLHAFSEKEWMLLTKLNQGTLSYSEITKFLGVKSIYALLKSLSSKDAIILIEEIKEKYQPKKAKLLRFTNAYTNKKSLEKLFSEITRKPQMEAAILKMLQDIPLMNLAQHNTRGVLKSGLVSSGVSASTLNSLKKQNIIEEFDQIIPRFENIEITSRPPLLSEAQEHARNEILNHFNAGKTVLLHGITGSGKTEIYTDLIEKVLASGMQALLLLPEIAITTQLVTRIKKVFGNDLGVYHSRFSDNERVEVWRGILEGKYKCIIGVRSSVFLPFDNLGLIIVDEEHDPSYKQDRPPRYHARSAAQMLGRFQNAKILLGSATPALESYHHATSGNYGLVTLNERFGGSVLPEIKTVDLSEERKHKTLNGSFSTTLIAAISAALKNDEQVILFQNRRGYSPIIECEDCSYVPQCINCSVSLTYHQFKHALICHYCGYSETPPIHCPSCTGTRIHSKGTGTEKIEEEARLLFPEVGVARMDLDTTQTKSGFAKIIDSVQTGKAQILIGTQMVTKGLDFDKVSLVGVFDSDRLVHFPDFRAQERAFQLLSQVSGRAGRRNKKGLVLIQTNAPDLQIWQQIISQKTTDFLLQELNDRQKFHYPPFTRLLLIILKNNDKPAVLAAATWMATAIKQITDILVLGPTEPGISKIRNEYIQHILIKIPRNNTNLQHIKQHLLSIEARLLQIKDFKRTKIIFDVDPN